ncbi:MAG TPA: hypothetical protein VMW72_11485 [Sedimentisphaerales bacterium]|nr:hypothetical protein [Sedimentisphaerales bacterium]
MKCIVGAKEKNSSLWKFLSNTVRWSCLWTGSRFLFGRALIVLSLAPVLARLLHLMEKVGVGFVTVRLAVLGAATYSLGSLLTRVLAPDLVKNNANGQACAERMARMADAIDTKTFFIELPRLRDRYMAICQRVNAERLKNILPVEKAYQLLARKRATYLLSETLYELSDVERPVLRLFIGVLLLVGSVTMFWSVIVSVVDIAA